MNASPQQRLSTAVILVVDTETTGIDTQNDRVVELGAAYFQNGLRQRLHRMLVNPGVPIPPAASAVHGISDAQVAGEPDFAAVGARLALHLSGEATQGPAPVIAGYNAVQYDAAILNAEFARHGLPHRIDPARVVDPMVFMKWHHRDLKGRKLTEACEHYGVSLTAAHTAAADAQATGELLYKLVEAGKMPDDVEACLAEQARFKAQVDAEYGEWRSWLYRDRTDGELRIGAGKHVGLRPETVEASYFRFVLEKMEDLPPAVREVFGRYV